MRLSLRAKLIGGFSIVALIALVIGVIGWWGVNSLSNHLKDIAEVRMLRVQYLLQMDRQFEGVVMAQRTMLNPELSKEQQTTADNYLKSSREKYAAVAEKFKPLLISAEDKASWDRFMAALDGWKTETNKFMADRKLLAELGVPNPLRTQRDISTFIGDHFNASIKVQQLLSAKKNFDGGADSSACNFGKWLQSKGSTNASGQIAGAVAGASIGDVALGGKIAAIMDQAAIPHAKFHAAVAKIKQCMKDNNPQAAQAAFASEFLPAMEQTIQLLNDAGKIAQEARDVFKRMNNVALVAMLDDQEATLKELQAIIDTNIAAAEKAKRDAFGAAAWASRLSMLAVALGVLAALLLGFVIATSVTRSLNRIIDGLNSSADQVSAAADQVSSSGQDLAQGASEQASSLEETSASLEEMNSMTKQNAENAYNADSMSKATSAATAGGVKAMEKMSEAIAKIKSSSDETAKIIKTIDEIAFQTNLLALNAAVEAARAGEAGKGFAVVAEEVRNLAQRSAEAAKNTSALIEGSKSNSEEGVRVAKEVGESLTKINGNVGKVGALISEISAASGEQAKGIDQINRAVAEMDKLTQQNASNSEESASAAEELSAQAGELKSMVGQLVGVVTGNVSEERAPDLRRPPRRPQAPAPRRQLAPSLSAKAERQTTAAPAKRISAAQAEKAIPLDDDDFKDF